MSKLLELQSEIAKLQAQAQQIKSREFDSTVAEIRAKMEAFGITVKDLQSPSKAKRGRKPKGDAAPVVKKEKKAKAAVAPKYRGSNGETWSGRGLTPKWMVAAIAAGQSKESMLIGPAV